jgi:colicin import membrane protein
MSTAASQPPFTRPPIKRGPSSQPPAGAPASPPPDPGKRLSAALTAFIHLFLLAVLVIGIKWQTRAPEPVFAELWSPTATPQTPPPPPPAPRAEPKPEPRVEPKPEPRPEPRAAPEPKVEKPDIALEQERQRKEKERREREEKERKERLEKEKAEKLEKEKAEREKAEKEKAEKDKAEKLRKERELAEAKAKDDALRRELARENAERIRRELAGIADSPKPAAASNVGASASRAGDPAANAAYIDKIRAKVKGNVVLPQDLTGNPEAIFDVVQLPTGEVLSAKLRKSSGFNAYDEAVERAILKSSPLPRPDRPELFERNLVLRFRPQE